MTCIDEKRSETLEIQMEEMKKERTELVSTMKQQTLKATEEEQCYKEIIAHAASAEKEKVNAFQEDIAEYEKKLVKQSTNEKMLTEQGKRHTSEKSVLKKEVLRQRRESEIREVEVNQLKSQVSQLNVKVVDTEKKLMAALEDLNVANKERRASMHGVTHNQVMLKGGGGALSHEEVVRSSFNDNDYISFLNGDRDMKNESEDACNTCRMQ